MKHTLMIDEGLIAMDEKMQPAEDFITHPAVSLTIGGVMLGVSIAGSLLGTGILSLAVIGLGACVAVKRVRGKRREKKLLSSPGYHALCEALETREKKEGVWHGME